MKVLCISLLRLGDIFMQVPLFESMKKDGKKVSLLVNKQFQSSERFLLNFVESVYYFDRETYQRSCGEPQFNLMYGYQQIKELIAQLNLEMYDAIYNFTNTRLSAVLMGSLESSEKRGFQYLNQKFQSDQSPWLDYLNSHFSFTQGSVFHYTEILGNAFEIPVSAKGARKKINRKDPVILLQCFTNDSNKNWPLFQFKILSDLLKIKYPFGLVRVIAAPNEVKELSQYFSDDEIWVSDIEAAFEILKQADLFVGLDTSIKHLAALAQTPTVEINLGPSDFKKTGAFLTDVWNWSSQVLCAPCNHGQKCSQVSLKCVESLEVATVMNLIEKALAGIPQQKSGDEFADRLIWSKYLSKDSLHLYEAGMYLQLSPAYVQNTMHLSKWQQRLEMALAANISLAGKSEINKNDLADFLIVTKEILGSKLDKGSYFLKTVDALIEATADGTWVHGRLKKAIHESGVLLQNRKEIIKGYKDARIVTKTTRDSFSPLTNG